jgi:hypothetical protein
MGFADGYLLKQGRKPLISEPPVKDLRCIVVIPAFKEEQLHRTLLSLQACEIKQGAAEVLVLVNAPASSPAEVIRQSEYIVNSLRQSFPLLPEALVRFHILPFMELPLPDAGVGLARKIGMDEAVARFNILGKPDGIIASCDADAVYESNYLEEMLVHFSRNPKSPACSIYFEHELEGDYPQEILHAITQYEMYLRYYRLALEFTGHPHAYHTLGSSFAVKANCYCSQGGMNKRKAGEDFYFLQKIIPLGNFTNLKSTRILLSPRSSDRVPFGTGAAVSRIIESKSDAWYTYDFNTFLMLRDFFNLLYRAPANQKFDNFITEFKIPHPLCTFLEENEFASTMEEIQGNTAGSEAFTKRFFRWFNAFRVLKFLNYSHEHGFEKKGTTQCVDELLQIRYPNHRTIPADDLGKLMYLRELDRN